MTRLATLLAAFVAGGAVAELVLRRAGLLAVEHLEPVPAPQKGLTADPPSPRSTPAHPCNPSWQRIPPPPHPRTLEQLQRRNARRHN